MVLNDLLDQDERVRGGKLKEHSKYFREHPNRFFARVVFEPGYAIRNVRTILSANDEMGRKVEGRIGALVSATVVESIKLAIYINIAYKLGKYILN